MSIDDLIQNAEDRVWAARLARTDLDAHTVSITPIDGWSSGSADDIVQDLRDLCERIDPNFGKPSPLRPYPASWNQHLLRTQTIDANAFEPPRMMWYPPLYQPPKPCHGCGMHYGHVDGCPQESCPSTERLPAKCECGVKFTGGLHSDWCPAQERP